MALLPLTWRRRTRWSTCLRGLPRRESRLEENGTASANAEAMDATVPVPKRAATSGTEEEDNVDTPDPRRNLSLMFSV